MQNLQTNQKEPEELSPEWFYSEAQTPKYLAMVKKAETLRSQFMNRFDAIHLKALSGKDLLTSLFYNNEGNKTNLCYMLEMDKDMREIFGGISGGSAYKFGLFFHKGKKQWTTGSPMRPILLSESEAIQKAEEIRDNLVKGIEIISAFHEPKSESDYQELYKYLKHIPGINTVCALDLNQNFSEIAKNLDAIVETYFQ